MVCFLEVAGIRRSSQDQGDEDLVFRAAPIGNDAEGEDAMIAHEAREAGQEDADVLPCKHVPHLCLRRRHIVSWTRALTSTPHHIDV